MTVTNRWLWAIAVVFLSLIGPGSLAWGASLHGRWDIVSVQGADVVPGGVASAMANDGSLITLTGSGTFVAPKGRGAPHAVTGGGTWETRGFLGVGAASGTYSVTALVHFEPAPGTLPAVHDLVGDADEASAGLLVLRIAYSDGSEGILVVSCRLEGSFDTDAVFEGVTATKGFVDFWRNFPIRGSNRTLFHVRQ
jgi:hypothetical protein